MFSKPRSARGRRSTAYRGCRPRPWTIFRLPCITKSCGGFGQSPPLPMGRSEFVFDNYEWQPNAMSLVLRYRFADGPRFEERLWFEVPPRPLSAATAAAVDRIF